MTRTPLAMLLTIALVLPQVATPAFADQRGYAHRHGANGPLHTPRTTQNSRSTNSDAGAAIAVLGGLAIAAIIANEVRDNKKEREADQRLAHQSQRHIHQQDRFDRDYDRGNRHHGNRDRGNQYHGHERRRAAKILPARCYWAGHGRHGEWTGWGARCLERHVAQPRLLPRRCLRTVETRHGIRDIYRGRCLRREGWERQNDRH